MCIYRGWQSLEYVLYDLCFLQIVAIKVLIGGHILAIAALVNHYGINHPNVDVVRYIAILLVVYISARGRFLHL